LSYRPDRARHRGIKRKTRAEAILPNFAPREDREAALTAATRALPSD